jgi:pilus assembly protein Flp/PilA
MKTLVIQLWRDEEGQDLTEYALLVVLISLVAIAAIGKLGNAVNSIFTNAVANLSSAT